MSRKSWLVTFVLLAPLQGVAQEKGGALAAPRLTPGGWSYTGEKGPAHWGSIREEFPLCCVGRRQSPIDINRVTPAHEPLLNIHYHTTTTALLREPYRLMLEYDPGSYLKIRGQRYRLVSFDFHTPGEHSFQGSRPDMEIHLHHLGPQGEPLILSIPLVGGHRHNVTLGRILENLPPVDGRVYNRRAGINVLFLLPRDRSYYTYEGSETRPPCQENIQWVVFKNPVRVSWEDIQRIHAVVGDNNRPIQPRNGRVVWADEP